MSDRAALITALILERPLCLPCIADKSLMTIERATKVLETIETALVLRRQTAACAACGTVTAVYAVGRPPLT